MNKKDIDYTCYLVTDHKDKTNEEILNIIEEALKGGTGFLRTGSKSQGDYSQI